MWRKDLGTVLLHSLIPVSGPRFLLTYPSCIRNVRSPEKPLEFFQQGVVCWREKLAMVCNVFVKGMLELFSEYHHLQEGRGSYISIRNHFISPPRPHQLQISPLFPEKLSKDIFTRAHLHGMRYAHGLQNTFMQLWKECGALDSGLTLNPRSALGSYMDSSTLSLSCLASNGPARVWLNDY